MGTAGSAATVGRPALRGADFDEQAIAPFRTPHKYGKLVLAATGRKGDFDERTVDDPIVFYADGSYHMLYIGWDGVGYQTGLATSADLVNWTRIGCVGPRDPKSQWTKYNLAISSILRDKNLESRGDAKKVGGKYLSAWHAYPRPGLEEGAAVIGLAWSDDLLHWKLTDPILFPQDGAPWEHGGLYRPDLLEDRGTYYLYYNAKTDSLPQSEGGGWREQTGVATSRDLTKWVRYEGNPILRNGTRDARDGRFASNPYVVRHRDLWGMYYFGLNYHHPGKAIDLLALGRDPLHFEKTNEVIIDTGSPGSIDETYAHKPSVISRDGVLYHFYCAVRGKWPDEVRGISVARSVPW
jgi:predicted GH43/DUF377 family glycosyl hydrolase